MHCEPAPGSRGGSIPHTQAPSSSDVEMFRISSEKMLRSAAMPWLASAILTVIAYAPALTAGFMYDDPLDLPRATTRSIVDILTSPGASSYYRPLPLLIWHLLHALLGRNDPVLLHALSLVCHAVAGGLVYQLGSRLMGRAAGLVAAGLFLWYPPSYQVVGFVNVFFHGLAAMWVLAAAVLYWDARQLNDRRRLGLALGCTALSLLSHESAVTILPIVLGLEVLLIRRDPADRVSFLPGLFVLEVALYLAVWLAMPRLPVHSDDNFASVPSNALYFLQGLTSPVSSLLGYLPRIGSDATTLIVASLLTLAVILARLVFTRRLTVGLLGAIWFGAAVAPSILLLPWESYVSNAPRLLYLASAGTALIWAAAIAPGPSRPADVRSPLALRLKNVVATAMVAAILVSSVRFIAIREATQSQGADIVAQVVSTAAANDGAHATYINVPSFLTPRDSGFLFGHWGITMIPQYVYDLGFVVYVATDVKPSLSSAFYNVLARDWDHFYGPHGYPEDVRGLQGPLRQGGPVYVTRFDPGRLSLEYAGRVDPGTGLPTTPIASFSDWALAQDAQAQIDFASPNQVTVRVKWQARGTPPGDYTVFVHLVDATGAQIGQADGYPIAAIFPPSEWRAGDHVEDVRTIPIPPGAALGAVLIGLYDRANPSIRAPAQDGRGAPLPDDSLRVPVTSAPGASSS
jgi:hypothetical protein